MKKLLALSLTLVLVLSFSSCGGGDTSAENKKETTKAAEKETQKETEKETTKAEETSKEETTAAKETVAAEQPGDSGFTEIEIGQLQVVGPYEVAAVYFQAVDMYPADKNPSREESDMHLEADIHLTPDASAMYGFGGGEGIWPAYLTVKYEVLDKDKKVVTEGSFMPMNADDGPHYGTNIKKGEMTVGKYTLKLTIVPPTDYLLHTDDVTGVPAKADAKNYFTTQTVEFEWDYTGEQLQNE